MARPVDEWGQIIDKQVELNRYRDYEDRVRQQREKEQYKDSLQYQQQLRQLQRDRDVQEKQLDFDDIQGKISTFNHQEQLKRQQETALKQHLANEYKQHQELLKQRALDEKRRAQVEEQQRLERLRQQKLEDDRRQVEMKQRLNQEQKEILSMKRQQKEYERQAHMHERQYEVQLNEARRAREEQKERDYKDYYQQLHTSQLNEVNKLDRALVPKNERDMQIATWIDKNYYEQQHVLAKKEDYERKMREINMQQMNEVLKAQLEEKERQRQRARQEHLKEVQETHQRVEMHRRLEEQRERERRMNQEQYKNVLNSQAIAGHDMRLGAYKLTDIEKRMNRNMLDERQALVNGANEILRPSRQGRNLSFEDNARKFYTGSETSTPNPVQGNFRMQERRQKSMVDTSDKITRVSPNAFNANDRPAGAPTQKHIWF